ncbi:hypothetical protein FHS86_000704 [Roseimarinus sediminis]
MKDQTLTEWFFFYSFYEKIFDNMQLNYTFVQDDVL